jgi:hypothetical protein
LKPLYVRGHIYGSPISRMLVDDGVVVNLILYSMFKKLGRADGELMKTTLKLNGVGGDPMEPRGVISTELMVGSQSLATDFLIIEVQSNYIVVLGRDWIHANRCGPSTLHKFLIQRIDDEIEVVHLDVSSYIALADVSADWQDGIMRCLSGRDILGYDFLSITKDGFVPVSVQPAFEAPLGDIGCQLMHKRM